MLTYGDGVGNVPLDELLAFHRSRGGARDADRGAPAGAVRRAGVRRRPRSATSRRSPRCTKAGSTAGSSSSSRRRSTTSTSDVMWEHAPLEALAADGSWSRTATRTSGSAWTRCATCATWSRCGTPGGRRGRRGRRRHAESARARSRSRARAHGELWERAARRAHLHHRRDRLLRLLAARDVALGERSARARRSVVVLTRDRRRVRRRRLRTSRIIRRSRFTTATSGRSTFPAGPFSHVIHAATDSRARARIADRMAMFDTIVTARAGRWISRAPAGATRFLLTSSGAVYGRAAAGADARSRGLHRRARSARCRARLRRGQARGRDALRASTRTARSAADDRAVLRVRRPVPAARRAFRRREFHPRRARGRPDPGSATARRTARTCTPRISRSGCGRFCCAASRCAPTTSVPKRRSRSPIWRDAVARRFTPEPDVRIANAAAGRDGSALRAEHGAERAASWASTMTVDLDDALTRPWIGTGTLARSPMSTTERALQVGSRRIGPGEPCYVIAEVGINHNGDLGDRQAARRRRGRGRRRRGQVPEAQAQRDLPRGDHRPAAPRRAGTAGTSSRC